MMIEKTTMIDKKNIMLIIMVIMIACNLRAPVTCVGALVNDIQASLGLSPEAAGSITTIPLLTFAAVSPAAVFLSERIGAGKTLAAGFAVMCIGIAMRSYGGIFGMFAGTVVIGGAIGLGNVMLPAIIKSRFPDRIESLTSLYTMIMQIVSAVGTAVSVPIAAAAGWNESIFIWILPAFLAMLLCVTNRHIKVTMPVSKENKTHIYKKKITWWVTLYMGTQSFIFYCFIAWLSPMLQSRGWDDGSAGYLLSVYVVMGMAGSAFLPVIMKKNSSQSKTGVQTGVIYAAGMIAVAAAGDGIVSIIGIALCGFCSGLCISFSMALFGLHTDNGRDASKLSGFAQSAGYLIAAAGPLIWGKIYGETGSFDIPVIILVVMAVLLIFLGKKAGKEEII